MRSTDCDPGMEGEGVLDRRRRNRRVENRQPAGRARRCESTCPRTSATIHSGGSVIVIAVGRQQIALAARDDRGRRVARPPGRPAPAARRRPARRAPCRDAAPSGSTIAASRRGGRRVASRLRRLRRRLAAASIWRHGFALRASGLPCVARSNVCSLRGSDRRSLPAAASARAASQHDPTGEAADATKSPARSPARRPAARPRGCGSGRSAAARPGWRPRRRRR